MNKAELLEKIANESHVNKNDTLKVFEATLKIIKDELSAGNNVVITGFGAFRIGNRNARIGIKPKTGEKITIAPRRVVTFKPSVPLKNQVNKQN